MAMGDELFTPSFQFLTTYNDMHLESIIFVSRVEYNAENDTNREHSSLVVRELTDYHDVPVVFVPDNKNLEENLKKVTARPSRSLVILYDYETSTQVQSVFEKMKLRELKDDCWLLVYSSISNEDELNKAIIDNLNSKEDIQVDSQIYVQYGSYEHMKLIEVYRPCSGHDIVFKALADFSNGTLRTKDHMFIWNRRSNLELCQLKITYVDWKLLRQIEDENLVYLNESNSYKVTSDGSRYSEKQVLNLNNKNFVGPESHMFKLLLSTLNFSVSWIDPIQNHWGTIDPDTREWGGMVGKLANNQADMSIASLIVTQLRGTVIAYSTPLFRVQYKLVMTRPDSFGKWRVYVDAFDIEYWMTLALTTALCSVALLFFLIPPSENLYPKKTTLLKKVHSTSVKLMSGTSAMLLSYGLQDVQLARSCPYNAPNSNRLMFWIICLFGSLNNYIFSSEIISRIMQSADVEIHSLSDILTKPNYKLIVNKGTAQESYLSESFDIEHQRIWEKTIQEKGVIEGGYGITKELIDEDFHNVALIPSPYFEMTASNSENLYSAPQTYAPTTAAYGFYNNSPYIDLFNHHIRQTIQAGLNHEMPNLESSHETGCNINQNNQYRPFDYHDVFSLFALFGVGLMMAIIYCAFENIKRLYFFKVQPTRKLAKVPVRKVKSDNWANGKGLRSRNRILKTQKSFSKIKASYLEQLNEEATTNDQLMDVMKREINELTRLMKLNKCFATIFSDILNESNPSSKFISKKELVRKKSD